MKKLMLTVASGIALMSAVSAQAQDRELRIDCGDTDVIMSVDQAVVIKENTDMTAEEIAARTCEAALGAAATDGLVPEFPTDLFCAREVSPHGA